MRPAWEIDLLLRGLSAERQEPSEVERPSPAPGGAWEVPAGLENL